MTLHKIGFWLSRVFICVVFLLIGFLSSQFVLESHFSFDWLPIILTIVSLILTVQGTITLLWMLYAWEDPENIESHGSPKTMFVPKFSFTALVPARHEEAVIQDTILAINNIDYPDNLKEVLVICHVDDLTTITKVSEVIASIGQKNIKLILFDGEVINKPHGLNIGFKQAKCDIVTIFDAEDSPHPDIYKIINTVMTRDKVDIVQSGVQLINFRSHWFSALNVMEYFLWFKSGLHFFLKIGQIIPLAGNTVFFKKEWLKAVNGWDENCLTEDADIGIRLTLAGASTSVIYDEKHATHEETPSDTAGFVKQRTRWNQGFMQIFVKGDWQKLPKFRQKVVILYILLSSVVQALFLPYIPLILWISFTQKVSVIVSLLSFIPLGVFILQILVYIVCMHMFTRSYKLKFSFWTPFVIIFSFIPYQCVLMFSTLRALSRVLFKNNSWEKTSHVNDHRHMAEILIPPVAPLYVK